jgi:hypothetical protein
MVNNINKKQQLPLISTKTNNYLSFQQKPTTTSHFNKNPGFSLNNLTLPHVYVCPKPRHGFPFVVVFFVFNDLK